MQFEIEALQKLQFKKTVDVEFPLNKVDENGKTEKGHAIFIGHFQQVDDAVRDQTKAEIQAIQDDINATRRSIEKREAANPDDPELPELWSQLDTKEKDALKKIKSSTPEFMTHYFVGFEKHPKHDFPFLADGQPMESNAETIRTLLNIERVRDAIAKAYYSELNKGLEKMLEGNSKA